MKRFVVAVALVAAACGSQEGQVRPVEVHRAPVVTAARLPAGPGRFAPSLVAIEGMRDGELTDGEMLSDVDSCATCHPDAAAQWATSPHSFASFGNPIYRVNVEL